ncbi:MAG: FlgO family outer membrane protein [Elusimicrobiales bacterium]
MVKLAILPALLILFPACLARQERSGAHGQEDPYLELAAKLSPTPGQGIKTKAAVLPFSDLSGSDSPEGALVAERLLTRLASTGGFEVVERRLLEKLLGELKLQASGATATASEQNIGRLLGVEAVISGTISKRKDGAIEINARVISVRDGKVGAAGMAVVPADWAAFGARPVHAAQQPAPPANLPRQPLSRSQPGEFSLAGPDRIYYLSEGEVKNFEASIELFFDRPFSAAGLIFRDIGPGAFYQYEWYTEGDNISATELGLMYGRENGWRRLASPFKRPPQLNRWYEFKVRAKNDAIKCYLDGKLVFDISDSRYPGPGKIGLRIWLNNPVKFRNFRLTEI